MLVKTDPFLAEFDRLSQQVFGGSKAAGMPMDVTRQGDMLTVRLDVPGVARESLGIDLDKHILTITAERHASYDDQAVVVQERFDGTMTRRLRVPEWVDVDRVSADYTDGVLTITLPIAEQAKPRRISVTTAGPSGTEALEA
jgi:HSP20 family protein